MNKSLLRSRYDNEVGYHEQVLKLGTILLKEGLDTVAIDYFAMQTRIKSFESFFEKIGRKGYKNPFLDVEDIAGIRVICYYPSDVSDIEKLIREIFDVQSTTDKSNGLDIDRFGYRSNHYVVKLKDKSIFSSHSNNLKIEIQVRTLLMHVWASIQGKLEYKKEEHSPPQFRRKLMQLSAILELADQQFQDLKEEKEALRNSLIHNEQFSLDTDMNIDSFFTFINLYFPNHVVNYRYTKTLFIELKKLGIGFKELLEAIQITQNIIDKVEIDHTGVKNVWSRDQVLRTILELSNENFWLSRSSDYTKSNRGKLIVKWRKALKDKKTWNSND